MRDVYNTDTYTHTHPITASNFNKYCSNYREYRLNEFHRQIEFIRQGLYSVVPDYFLSLFTPDELEEAVCGKGDMDVGLLKRNTDYGGQYNPNSQAIVQFWTVLSEKFTEEQKKFVWGRCTLLKCDEDFTSKFRIDSYDVSNGVVDGALSSKFHEKSDQSYFFQIFCGNVHRWEKADSLKLEILFDMIIDRLNIIEHFRLLF